MGPAFLKPTMFSGFVCFAWCCVGFFVSWSLVRCMSVHVVFVSNYSIKSELLHTTGSVYKHRVCVSVYRAFSVLGLLDLFIVTCLVFLVFLYFVNEAGLLTLA